jgi:superfamily II DNA/RNA helicase
MEAIATAFALDVPSIALMVIPPASSVHRAVFDLRQLGINAHGLDLLSDENGRAFLNRTDARTVKTNPTLLVATAAAVRGIDLPDMSHVFILGVPGHLKDAKFEGRLVDAYLHIAGRVGRSGRGGKVVTIIEDLPEDESQNISEKRQDRYRITRLLNEIGAQPQKYSLFD